jgi:hypothetical protein
VNDVKEMDETDKNINLDFNFDIKMECSEFKEEELKHGHKIRTIHSNQEENRI